MDEKTFNLTFSKNLNYFLNLNNKTQLDLAKYVGVSTASVSNWCKGIKVPRLDKVDKICTFFNIVRSDLLEYDGPVQRESRIEKEAILNYYGRLNSIGKREATKRVEELTHIPIYTEPDHLRVQAAHERTDIEVTDEMRKHDDDIMNDENF